MTEEEFDAKLTDTDCSMRRRWVCRSNSNFVPTPSQVERGLTDTNGTVRQAFAERTDFVPTPFQVERGLTDENSNVRQVFQINLAKWEAQRLKNHYSNAIAPKTKLKAL